VTLHGSLSPCSGNLLTPPRVIKRNENSSASFHQTSSFSQRASVNIILVGSVGCATVELKLARDTTAIIVISGDSPPRKRTPLNNKKARKESTNSLVTRTNYPTREDARTPYFLICDPPNKLIGYFYLTTMRLDLFRVLCRATPPLLIKLPSP
jgi:hypothetical protein